MHKLLTHDVTTIITTFIGLLGEGGQYALPEGEWFCTACYSDTSGENDNAENNKGGNSHGIADVNSGENDQEGDDEGAGADRKLDAGTKFAFFYSVGIVCGEVSRNQTYITHIYAQ